MLGLKVPYASMWTLVASPWHIHLSSGQRSRYNMGVSKGNLTSQMSSAKMSVLKPRGPAAQRLAGVCLLEVLQATGGLQRLSEAF